MRILYDHQIFSTQEYGGISRYYYEVASRISKCRECDVSIYAPLYVNRYIRNDENYKIVGLPIHKIPKTGKALIRLNTFLCGIFPQKGLPDIVHETYYAKNSTAPANAKTVLTVYDMIHERFKEILPSHDKTSLNKEFAVKRADHIICISENTKNDLMDIFNVRPEKISVIYLGYTLGKKSSQSEFKISKPYILYVGERLYYKNFNRLLQAYSLSLQLQKDFDLVCFGGGGFSNNEINQIKKLDLKMENIIHMTGGDNILSTLYSNAAIFIFPSLYEGFGIPPLEAMSFNCPVACSNKSSIPEVTGDAAEYFDPYNIEEMMFSIESVVFSNEKRNKLIEKGLERIKLFSWEKCARQTLETYSSIL